MRAFRGFPLTEATPSARTPLYEAHVAAGARIVDFAGWEMPVQYAGVIAEHNAVRTKVGLFDVSHMGEAEISGPDALALLQHVTCNDVAKLRPGRAHYTALTLPNGAFVDDLLVYMRGEARYLLVLNAANTAKDVAWLREHAEGREVEVVDASPDWAQIAIQGPAAEAVLQRRVEADLSKIAYYRFRELTVEGADCIVSRTGYTGEDGFEVYAPPPAARAIWDGLLAAGADDGILPVGLAARDTLRLEARMALYGNDIDETTTVLEAGLGWIVKLRKGEFIGRDVLARQKREGVTRKLVGFEMEGRAIPRQGYPVLRGDEIVGKVTSGTRAPYLERNIGLTYLPEGMWDAGSPLSIEIRGRREPARVVPTPFYKRQG